MRAKISIPKHPDISVRQRALDKCLRTNDPAAVSKPPGHKKRHRLRVLVIDDDKTDYLLIDKCLSQWKGYECVCAHVDNFDDGLDAVRSGKFDVALVDYLLGPRSGLDLIRESRGHLAPMPIIVLTGHGDLETDLAALDLGASEYLDKSELSPTALERTVRYACAHHKIERRLRKSERRMREAVREAKVANSAKSAFLAKMSHELRTPLNAIIGFSDILMNERMGPLGSAKYQEYAEAIHDSGLHQLDVINDILDLSKVEAGQLDLLETDIDLSCLIECCAQTVKGWEEGADRQIDQRIEIDLPLLHADERRVKQILLNLLTNAIKFTPRMGSVLVEAKTDTDRTILLSVRDSGAGIAECDLERVMTLFGQGDDPHVRSHQGTGLGLPLTKALVEAHGATLDLTSEPGVGTSVTMRFPSCRTVTRRRPIARRRLT